ncbi:hypothetical protein PO909_012006 [Leuciscus waleckii]
MRNDNEFQSVKSALLAAEDRILNSKLWIGLALRKGRCTDNTEDLNGFRWTSEPSESKYSNWKKEPLSTYDLKWTGGSCKESAFYICKFLSKGWCNPIVMEKPGHVKLAMLPHGTWAEILCGGSEDAESFISFCDNKDGIFGWTNSERFCARDNRSGEHRCHNTPGSFLCECNPGFRLFAGKCKDVDECTESMCEQGCLNSQGSFSCYCHAGYALLSDRGICTDIDECLGNVNPCEDICLNTKGSFKCSCRENFILAKNGISCIQDPTENPQNTPPPVHREEFITKLSHLPVSFESTTINSPPLNKTNTKVDSTKRRESFLGSSWILVCVLASVFALVSIIAVISVVLWKRSKKATLKNTTADNYCWVSSGLDKERKKATFI